MEVDKSDLLKIRDALQAATEHHIARDRANAKLHLAHEVRYSPLTSTLMAANERLAVIVPDHTHRIAHIGQGHDGEY